MRAGTLKRMYVRNAGYPPTISVLAVSPGEPTSVSEYTVYARFTSGVAPLSSVDVATVIGR